jgi:uncharacterized coiled-coil DUF342 family protein
MTDHLTTERLREIAEIVKQGCTVSYDYNEVLSACSELLAKREECEALQRESEAVRNVAKLYHDALVARHGGEPIALLSELDEARADAERLRAALKNGGRAAGRAMDELRAELAAVKRQRDELQSQLSAHAIIAQLKDVDRLVLHSMSANALAASQPAAEQPKPEVQP